MKDNSGPAFPTDRICGKTTCKYIATHKQGHQYLCPKHYRFGQMRVLAKRRDKKVPAIEELERMVSTGLVCQDCYRHMNWLSVDGQDTVITLQHYRDGTLGLVCRSCNTRHHYAPGDLYRQKGPDKKFCPKCGQFLDRSNFSLDSGRSGLLKSKSWCKTCSNSSVKKWQEGNREKYNSLQRYYRARRKAAGNPVSSGT